jgi:hypothetical protein
MAKTFVLDRVAADLARGYTHPAIQRLSSLVAAYPTDLDLRRRLAAVHRTVGNRVQAGRWDYLTIGASADDTTAFERAFPSAATRLREVRWPHRAGLAATAYARARLDKLIAAAEAERTAVAAARAQRQARQRARRQERHATAGSEGAVRRLAREGTSHGRFTPLLRTLSRLPRLPRFAMTSGVVAGFFFAVLGAATIVEWFVQ